MRTNSVGSTSHVAWENSTLEPHTPVDTFVGCFGSSAKPTPKTYSLAELYEQQNLLPCKTASELISLWHNLKQIDLKSPGLYTCFQAWRKDSNPKLFYRVVKEKMLEEISNRFLSGTSKLYEFLEPEIVTYVAKDIQWRVHKAMCYHNATLSGIKKYPKFDQIFMETLCTGDCCVSHIRNFFREAREFEIPHEHLFLFPELESLSKCVVEQLAEEAKQSHMHILGAQQAKQVKVWIAEYNQILETCHVPKTNWLSYKTPIQQAIHGYRLAALELHPDRNPKGTERFKRLTELAEKLGTKSA